MQSEFISAEGSHSGVSSVSEISQIENSSQSFTGETLIIQNLDELDYRYFKDVADASITSQSWNNASQIRPEFLINFFGTRTGLSILSIDSDSATAPEELVESFVQMYFNVDTARMRQSVFYNKEANTYDIPIPPGGAATYKVIDAVIEGNITTLSYEYYSAADDKTVIRKGILKIDTTDSLKYKYISCDTIEINE